MVARITSLCRQVAIHQFCILSFIMAILWTGVGQHHRPPAWLESSAILLTPPLDPY